NGRDGGSTVPFSRTKRKSRLRPSLGVFFLTGHPDPEKQRRCTVKTIDKLIVKFSGTAVAVVFGVFLAFTVLSPWAAAATDMCTGGILDGGSKGNPPDLVVTNMTCTADGTHGPYYFHN